MVGGGQWCVVVGWLLLTGFVCTVGSVFTGCLRVGGVFFGVISGGEVVRVEGGGDVLIWDEDLVRMRNGGRGVLLSFESYLYH